MNIGARIKKLRNKAGLTQDQLAARLGISGQAISKWETGVTMPDISLLPELAGELGVSIDELFDLTAEQKMHRIEMRIEREDNFSPELFSEYEEYLKGQLENEKYRMRSISLLADLYHHRMESDAKVVSRYARESIEADPGVKDCQWLLCKAEGAVTWDWNVSNHAKVIEFYSGIIKRDKNSQKTASPYYYLIDNLIADHRTAEARKYLDEYAGLPDHKPAMVPIYKAHIALAEYNETEAEKIITKAQEEFAEDKVFIFEAAQYYANKAEYEKAIGFYQKSWQTDEKPRYTDAMQGISLIREILGDFKGAAEAYDEIISCLKAEWGYSDSDSAVVEANKEKARILARLK